MKNNRVVFLTLAILMAPVAWWIARDRSVWLWDQAWYGEVSADIWFNAHQSLLEWGRSSFLEMNLKPPGIVWAGQLFVALRALFGSVENALLAFVLIAQVIYLWLIYKIGEALQPAHRWVPLIGVAFAAATQVFVGLSHQFMVEPLQAVAVAWVVLVAAKSGEWPAARSLVHLSAATLLGLLVKLSTPAYCFLFYPYIGWQALRGMSAAGWKAEWFRPSSRVLMLSFLAALPATATWYVVNAQPVWKHARESASGADVALHYGFRASVEKKLVVWSGLLYQSFLAPYLVWVLVLAVVLAVVYFSKQRLGRLLTLEALALGQVLIMLLLFSAADAVESRYLYAVGVYVALTAMVLCIRVRHGAIVLLLLAVCGWQWAIVNAAALGSRALADPSPLLVTAQPDPTEYDEITRMVERTSDAAGRYNVVGVEEPWLNANGASFFVAKRRLMTGSRCYYTSLGYAESDVGVALKRLDALNTHYFITLDEQHQQAAPDFLNMVSLAVLKAVREDARFHQIAFSSARGLLIFERQ